MGNTSLLYYYYIKIHFSLSDLLDLKSDSLFNNIKTMIQNSNIFLFYLFFRKPGV